MPDQTEERAERLTRQDAVRQFEEACNYVALVFGESEQRRVAIAARGDMREANGEART